MLGHVREVVLNQCGLVNSQIVDFFDFIVVEVANAVEFNQLHHALMTSGYFKPGQGYRSVHNHHSDSYLLVITK